jgi:hypothetical protein
LSGTPLKYGYTWMTCTVDREEGFIRSQTPNQDFKAWWHRQKHDHWPTNRGSFSKLGKRDSLQGWDGRAHMWLRHPLLCAPIGKKQCMDWPMYTWAKSVALRLSSQRKWWWIQSWSSNL